MDDPHSSNSRGGRRNSSIPSMQVAPENITYKYSKIYYLSDLIYSMSDKRFIVYMHEEWKHKVIIN